MAYDYQKVKSAYEGLNAEQKKQFAEQNKNDANFQQFVKDYAAEMGKRSSTPTTTTTTNIAKPEYQGTGGTRNVSNTYQNQGEGNYYYSTQTNRYEKYPTSSSTTAETPTTSTTPITPTTPTDNTSKSVREAWDKKSYQEQQDILNKNPSIREGLVKAGATFKTADTGETKKEETPTTPTTSGDGWDYQDNSPERMRQIADNVNSFAITDPGLFENEQTFRKAFIDGKGRTKEQEDFLMDLYKNRKLYNTLDNYTADQIGYMDAHGELNNSYLTYLKNSDPERYAAVMDAKSKEVDKIKDASNLDTIGAMTGESEDVTTSKAIEWLKSQGLFLDKDGNLIDDRTENYASEEEKTYLKALSDLAARNLEIDNIIKHSYEDLAEKYPGATRASLMAMAQDINSDLLREKENNNVEMARYQGYVGYMQSERQERDKVGQNAIEQLQKQYGMYYQYTPEGMSELAQAQYGATNITLDQADTGTETEKQMAVQLALSDYLDKYGDIIQRSEGQIINDVIAYSKQNGVSLAQAFQDNFVTPLQSKEAYKNIQAQLAKAGVTNSISWTKIGQDADGNDIYGFVDTTNMTVSPFAGDGEGAKYTAEEISSNRGKRQSLLSEVANEYGNIGDMANAIAGVMNGLGDGNLECGEYVNDYIYGVTGTQGSFGNEISQKTSICDNKDKKGIKVGDAIVFNRGISEPNWVKNSEERSDLLKYGHVGFITGIDDQGNVTMSHTVGGNVTTTTFNINGNNDYARNFAGSQTVTPKQTTAGGGRGVAYSYDVQVSKENNATQNKTYAFAQRAWEADEKIRDFERKYNGYRDSPIKSISNRGASLIGETTKSEDQKAYEQYKNEFVNAVLRWESGAAIGQTEFSDDEKGAIQRYFPQPGDSLDQITRKQKLRENYINNMMIQAGKTADGTPMSEIYSRNKIGNYANQNSSTKGEAKEYNWMEGF